MEIESGKQEMKERLAIRTAAGKLSLLEGCIQRVESMDSSVSMKRLLSEKTGLSWLTVRLCLAGFVVALTAGMLAGCTWTDRRGVQHTLIIGVGHVSRVATNGMTALDVRALGFVCDPGVHLGLVQTHQVEIDPNVASNAVISIKASPFSLTVKNFNPYEPNHTNQTERRKE